MADIPIKEEHQNLIEQLNEGLNLDPKYIQRFFITNLVTRSIAYLMAFDVTSDFPVKIRATSDGSLKVATTGIAYEHNQTLKGTCSDTEQELTFNQVVSRVDIWVKDNDMIISRSYDGLTYEDEIEISAGSFYSFDCKTKSIKVKNAVSGANATYQIVGWY